MLIRFDFLRFIFFPNKINLIKLIFFSDIGFSFNGFFKGTVKEKYKGVCAET